MKILLADDDAAIRKGIEVFLTNMNHSVSSVPDGKEALEVSEKEDFDLIISDVQMPEVNGLELLNALRQKGKDTPMIIITAFATVEDAVKAMKLGANDYLTKPLHLEELQLKIGKIEDELKLKRENAELKERLRRIDFPEMVGVSEAITEVKKMIAKIAQRDDVPVMIYGASGTGKELAAKAIHNVSKRNGAPFVAVNCAAMPDELLESELFGYVKGAFTGAVKDREGLFKTADGGTLFLDEVGEMSPRLQAKLLRALQDFRIQPLGTSNSFNVDVRIIGASNVRLQDLVSQNKFREDLFYRLNVAEISIPPLSRRKEDIPLLLEHFISSPKIKKEITFTKEALAALTDYNWPGNVRELENFVNSISVFAERDVIDRNDLPERILNESSAVKYKWDNLFANNNFPDAQKIILEDFEKKFLEFHLRKHNGNITRTAEAIGLSRVSLHKKINDYGLG